MCERCDPIDGDEFLLRRIYPGLWVAAQQRPATGNFSIRRGEAGLSLYRQSMCTLEEVMTNLPRPGFGLVQLRVGDIPKDIAVVITHPESEPNEALRRAHVELRYPDAAGGRDLTDSQQKRLARACTAENVLIVPALE